MKNVISHIRICSFSANISAASLAKDQNHPEFNYEGHLVKIEESGSVSRFFFA